jgi:hypothetical protein
MPYFKVFAYLSCGYVIVSAALQSNCYFDYNMRDVTRKIKGKVDDLCSNYFVSCCDFD